MGADLSSEGANCSDSNSDHVPRVHAVAVWLSQRFETIGVERSELKAEFSVWAWLINGLDVAVIETCHSCQS